MISNIREVIEDILFEVRTDLTPLFFVLIAATVVFGAAIYFRIYH